MEHYIHKVHYYETDKMGITHHSNYIRWMEEARVDYLDRIGFGFARLEREGIQSPVIAVDCKYLRPTAFDDEVEIRVRVKEFRGVRLIIAYDMFHRATGEQVLTGTSSHCFLDESGKPIVLKRRVPALDALLRERADAEGADA